MKNKIRVVLLSILIIVSFASCKSNVTKNLSHCKTDYITKQFYQHPSIEGLLIRFTKDLPDRIQVSEENNSIDLYYCNMTTSTEILLATYDIEPGTIKNNDLLRPTISTVYSDHSLGIENGQRLYITQHLEDFKALFIKADDIRYYNDHHLENVPFVLSTPCSDRYTNQSIEVSNLTRSVYADVSLIDPPSEIQLIKDGTSIDVLYCAFNDSSDRSMFLGYVTVMSDADYQHELSLFDPSVKEPILPIEKSNGYGVYLYMTQMQLDSVDNLATLFDNRFHFGDQSSAQVQKYFDTIYGNHTLKLKFSSPGMILSDMITTPY